MAKGQMKSSREAKKPKKKDGKKAETRSAGSAYQQARQTKS
ncbi:MAG: hypothetical protein ACREFD_09950 [Stellaceae bacterium]